MLLNRCHTCDRPGRCVDKDTEAWYCEEHGRQCDVLVPRPEGCVSRARNLPCSQMAHMRHQDGHFVCEDHLDDIFAARGVVTIRSLQPRTGVEDSSAGASIGPLDNDGESVDLDEISTIANKECPICLEPKAKWRILKACGHELCEDCLREQLRSSLFRGLLCPFDRRLLFDRLVD